MVKVQEETSAPAATTGGGSGSGGTATASSSPPPAVSQPATARHYKSRHHHHHLHHVPLQHFHHFHHHWTYPDSTACAPAGPATFHFGPGFEPQQPLASRYAAGPSQPQGNSSQPGTSSAASTSEHIVHFHVNPGVTVSFQIGDNMELIRGPVTVPMVSTNSSPPIAMPVQVPPGHVVQQIVDESGTLRHVILSPQPPLVAMPHNPQHYGGPGNGNSQPPQTFYAQGLAPGYGTAAAHYMGAGGGHLGHVGGGGSGHLGHSPPPAHPFHKDERTQRQYNKLKRKLEQKRSDVSGSGHSTPLLSPRKELVNGLRRGAAATAAHKERGMNSVGTSEDGEESSSVQDDEDEVNVITDILSSVQSPQVSELSSRSALLQWSVPARLSSGTTNGDHDLDISESELRYDVLLSDKGKEGKYKSIYSGAARSCRIEDLRPGHEYSVCVQVHLDELQGAASDPLTFTTPACEPDQPLPPRLISRTKTSLQLRWAAPNDNGSPVHQYVLECDDSKGAGFIELTKHRGRQFHMTKLQPSTVYRFRLTAVNDCGRSACSDVVSFATAGSPPAPPAPPHLEHAAVDSLRLVWSRRPSDDSFTLQMDSVHTGYGFMNEYVGKDTEYVCKNLARYSDYRFRLRAHSDEAAGSWSEEVCYRTLAAPPSTPSRPTVKGRPHAHSFKVRWEPPSDRGGADLTGYILELSSGSAFEQVYSGMDTEAVCDKLSAGTTYQVRVSCVGVGGRSTPSEPCTVTTEPVCPGKCTALRVHGRARATAMTLRWTEPDFSGGAPLAEYELELLDPRRQQLYRGREPEHTVTDLQPGTTYSFAVRAVNRAGHGPWSDVLTASSGAAPPHSPAAPIVTTRSPHSVLVEWAEPTTNGAPITEYRLEMSTVISQHQQQHDEEDENAEKKSEHEQQNQQQESTFSVVYTGIATSHELRSLAPFTTYFFRVQAVNAAGPGPFSSVGAALTPATVPAAPGVPRYEATATTLHLQWSEPAAHGSPIEHYIVEVGERAERTPDSVPECTVERLRPDTVFRVRVKAVNGIGVGPCSTSVRAATLPLPPPPPRLECLATGHNYLKLKWGDGRNADFTHYTLKMEHSRSKEFVCVYQGTNLTYKLNKLQELTAYRFRICATSDAGQGDYSDVCEFRTCVAPPATLKAPRVSDLAQRSALVEWLPCRMPTPDPIHYTLHLTRLRDQDFKQVYRGTEVKHTLTDLEAGVEYSVKVCPVRICTQGTELAGAFSPATTFATVAPEPVVTARTTAPTASGSPARGRKNQRLLSWLLGLPLSGDKRPITDTQWAILILVGFTLFAILAAVVVERLINWRKAV